MSNNLKSKHDKPIVCICIPTFNSEKTIQETLQSLQRQTYSDFIIKVVDNASTDQTLALVKALDDPRIDIFDSHTNIGAEANFERCIALSEGPYVAIYHADDVYAPDMVERQIAYLENNADVAAVFTNAILINEKGHVIGWHGLQKRFFPSDHKFTFPTIFSLILRYSNFFICPTAMVRGDVYRNDVRQWRGDLYRTSADLDVWFRILLKHPICILPDRLIRYRISQQQESTKLRLRLERSDLFLVLDSYLSNPRVNTFLSKKDQRAFRRLERTDRVVRAVNLCLSNKGSEAKPLVFDIFSLDAIWSALRTFRGFSTFAAGVIVRFILLLNLKSSGIFLLSYLKKLGYR